MSFTQNWNNKDYLKYIMDNNLHFIWSSWCNPKNTGGIRLAAYTPLFPEDDNIELYSRKCTRKGCTGNKVIPLDHVINRIIYKRVCNGIVNESACGAYQTILYRWISQGNRTKLWFNSPDTVKNYGSFGRTFYATSIIYSNQIVTPRMQYVDESLMKAASLYVDIDIKRGTICDQENRNDLQKTFDLLRDDLDTFVPNSYNLQTSGNGAYFIIHHNLVKRDIMNTLSKFNAWILHMDLKLKNSGITRVKIDPINMPSRVFKLMGSIHQTKDLVAVPLEYDVKIDKMSAEEFKLRNFDINKYIDPDAKKLKFYDRFNIGETKSLYQYLEENMQHNVNSDLRAIRHNYNEAISIITGEEQETADEYQKRLMREAEMYIDSITWKQFQCDIPGRIMYKETDSGYEIEMIGVDEDDIDKMLESFYEYQSQKGKNEGSGEIGNGETGNSGIGDKE